MGKSVDDAIRRRWRDDDADDDQGGDDDHTADGHHLDLLTHLLVVMELSRIFKGVV